MGTNTRGPPNSRAFAADLLLLRHRPIADNGRQPPDGDLRSTSGTIDRKKEQCAHNAYGGLRDSITRAFNCVWLHAILSIDCQRGVIRQTIYGLRVYVGVFVASLASAPFSNWYALAKSILCVCLCVCAMNNKFNCTSNAHPNRDDVRSERFNAAIWWLVRLFPIFINSPAQWLGKNGINLNKHNERHPSSQGFRLGEESLENVWAICLSCGPVPVVANMFLLFMLCFFLLLAVLHITCQSSLAHWN